MPRQKTSLTSILDTIYNSKNCIKKLVRVAGKICDNGHQFNCFEGLHIKKDKRGILGYHCGSFAIEKQLYELAEYGKEVELIIQDYTGSISDFITHTTEDNVYDTATKTA